MFDVLYCMDVLNIFCTLPAFLRDRAAEFFETLEDNVKNDYKLLCDSFKDRFLPNESQSVEDFASEITKLAARGLRSEIKRFAIMQQTVLEIMK